MAGPAASHYELIMIKKMVGRPPKFSEPSRPVTVTLPERVLEKLQLIDRDRGAAITQAVEALVADSDLHRPLVEIVQVCAGQGLIIVSSSKMLSSMPGVQLVEISPQRFLISLQPGSSVDTFELGLVDLIDHLPAHEASEIPLLLKLRETLKLIRLKQGLTKAEILLVPTM